mmetsp:Transcript_25497/g.25285  ORF Transcript_25497/g.25285 Transcript_25497/m.25285 type:complete len:189 (-) Transcript_25497:35-601(-)
MEKTALAILLIGAALLSYSPVTEYFLGEKTACSCDSIEDMIAWAEGKRSCVYKDSLGIPTIGIGFNLQRGDARKLITNVGANFDQILAGTQCLSDTQISSLFKNDQQWAESGAKDCIGDSSLLGTCVYRVVVDMTYNMGQYSLCSWTNFKSQLRSGNHAAAANNMASTKWCGQVGRRCTRNTNIVKSC